MSFDGLFTHAMVRELQGELQSGRVMKISQPYPYELMLSIRANRKTQTLLLSANPELRGYRLLPSPLPTPKCPRHSQWQCASTSLPQRLPTFSRSRRPDYLL